MITIRDIEKARARTAPYIHRTPLIHSRSLSALSGAEVYLKLENLQKTGSFKVRGAFNKLANVREDRVTAASMGNHAQAVAYAARELGKRARIIMPLTVPIVKEEATKGYGADVELVGDRFEDALAYALALKDYTFIHPFDDDDVIAGQGTIGTEILEDLPDVDTVFIAVGGGGLIGGTAAAIKARSPGTEVIGVQAAAAPAVFRSFGEKRIVDQKALPTIADGIAVNRPGDKTLELIMSHVDDMALATEEEISMSVLLCLERKKLVVEGAGAAPLAAFMAKRDRYRNKRVVLVLSGGNIDFTVVDRIIRKGLRTSGRIGLIEVTVDDIAGSLHRVIGIIASRRANVLDIIHDRLAAGLPFGKAKVIVTVEIREKKHLDQIYADLADRGYAAQERAEL